MGIILFKLIFRRRSCPHEAHITLYDIHKLRKLVYTRLTDEFAHFRNPRIVIHLEHQALHLVLRFQFLLPFLRINIHGPEFVYFESSSVLADSRLRKEYRPRRINPDRQRHKRRYHRRNQASHQSAHDINQTFNRHPSVVKMINRISHHRISRKAAHSDFLLRTLDDINIIMTCNPHRLQIIDNMLDIPFVLLRKVDEHLIKRHLPRQIQYILPVGIHFDSVYNHTLTVSVHAGERHNLIIDIHGCF